MPEVPAEKLLLHKPELGLLKPTPGKYVTQSSAEQFRRAIPRNEAGLAYLNDQDGRWDVIQGIAEKARQILSLPDNAKIEDNESRSLIPVYLDPYTQTDTIDLVGQSRGLAEAAVGGNLKDPEEIKKSTYHNTPDKIKIDQIRVGIPLQHLFAHNEGLWRDLADNFNYRFELKPDEEGDLTIRVKQLDKNEQGDLVEKNVTVTQVEDMVTFMVNNDIKNPKYLGVKLIGDKDKRDYFLQTAIYDYSNFPGVNNDNQGSIDNQGDTQPYRLPGVGRDPDATVEYKRPKVLEPEVGYEDANEQLVNYLSIPTNNRLQIGRGEKSDPNNNYINIDKSNAKSGLSRKHATISVEADGRTFYLDEGATFPNLINNQLIEKFTTREIPDKAILQLVQHEGAPRYQFYVVQTPEGAHFFKLSGNKKEWPQIIVSIQRRVRLDDAKLAAIQVDLEQKANS